jgi:glutamine synthetase
MMMAGLDGIENKIDPGQPLDKDIYGLSPEELKDIPNVASSLEDALNNLEQDHAFLLKGDVFTEDVIDMWISYKRVLRSIRSACGRCPKNSLSTSIADFSKTFKDIAKKPSASIPGAF